MNRWLSSGTRRLVAGMENAERTTEKEKPPRRPRRREEESQLLWLRLGPRSGAPRPRPSWIGP
jgi:hypothetical protein